METTSDTPPAARQPRNDEEIWRSAMAGWVRDHTARVAITGADVQLAPQTVPVTTIQGEST